jgi:DNA-binding NarL/FixJ family response regulator
MTVLLVDNSEIYCQGFKSFLLKTNIVETIHVLTPDQCHKFKTNSKVDLVLCDFSVLDNHNFNQLYKDLYGCNEGVKLVPTVHSVRDLDFSVFNKYNTTGIIYKSISFRDFEYFILSLTGKKISNNFINLLEQFAIEKRIQNRLEKKYRFNNILFKDEIYCYEINNPTLSNQVN